MGSLVAALLQKHIPQNMYRIWKQYVDICTTAREHYKYCLFQADSLLDSNMDREKEAILLTPINKFNYVSQFIKISDDIFRLLLYYL